MILDLSTLEEWKVVGLVQGHGNYPVVAPFSPTEVAIVGGNFNAPHNRISIFDSQTELSRSLSPQSDDSGVLSHYSVVVVSDQLAFAQTTDKESRYSLSEIILKDSNVTYKTVRLVAEAEDKAETLERYDLNHALKSTGKELTASQLKLFEDWWNHHLDIMLVDAAKDDCLFWLFKVNSGKVRVKKESGLVRDESTTRFKPLDKS